MKKILCFILIAVLSFVFIPNTVADEQVLYGDVNTDTAVNAKDALLVLRYAVEKEQLTQIQLQAADVTGQGDPNAKDALCILQKSVGKLRHFDVEKTLLTWQQPKENPRIRASGYPTELVVSYCNTYEELQAVLQREELPYSKEYFETGSLVLVNFTTPDTATTYYANDLYVNNGILYMEWDEKTSGMGGCMVEPWQYLLEVKEPLDDIEQAHCKVTRYMFDANGQEKIFRTGEQIVEIMHQFPLTWRQPEKNQRINAISRNPQDRVFMCNTYEELKNALPQENLPYTEEYFKTDSLIAFYVSAPNTAIYYVPEKFYVYNDVFYMHWEKTSSSSISGAAWTYTYYFVEVKGKLPDFTTACYVENVYKYSGNQRELYQTKETTLNVFPKN